MKKRATTKKGLLAGLPVNCFENEMILEYVAEDSCDRSAGCGR
jgi:hypothetical protein